MSQHGRVRVRVTRMHRRLDVAWHAEGRVRRERAVASECPLERPVPGVLRLCGGDGRRDVGGACDTQHELREVHAVGRVR